MPQAPVYTVEFLTYPSEGAPYLCAFEENVDAKGIYERIQGYDSHERYVDISGDPADSYVFNKDDEKHVLNVFVSVGPLRDVTLNV